MLLGEDQAETEAVAAAVRGIVDTVRQTTDPGTIVPAATSVHTASATLRTCRICPGIAAVVPKPILTPLPYIAAHIVYAKFIRLFRFNRMDCTATIAIIPRHIVYIAATAVLCVVALLTATCSVLPLCFGRKTESLACFLFNLWINSWQSSHETCSTGRLSP